MCSRGATVAAQLAHSRDFCLSFFFDTRLGCYPRHYPSSVLRVLRMVFAGPDHQWLRARFRGH